MHDFHYRNGTLYCEGMSVVSLARRYGTPLYLYSSATLTGHLRKLQEAFAPVQPLICYSVKANSNLALLRSLIRCGAGLDIVSGGELYRALRAGCPAQRIVYASVGKTAEEIAEAIRRGILFFNVESLPELAQIDRVARRLRRTAQIAIRINPDVEAKTHHYITTGTLTNKFGIDLKSARNIFAARKKFSRLRLTGVHIHIGSQITESAPFVAALTKIASFVKELKAAGAPLEYLNIGGGMGIVYRDETPQTAVVYARRIVPLLQRTGLRIIMEPGRFIVGNAGILAAKVLYVKRSVRKTFVIVDAGMNDLVRPSLYGAYHLIQPARRRGGTCEKVDVVGPICESGDFLAKERLLPRVKENDILAVMSAGAYGFSMSSTYNSRRRAAEVLVKGNEAYLVRRRDSFPDLVRNEIVPAWLQGKERITP